MRRTRLALAALALTVIALVVAGCVSATQEKATVTAKDDGTTVRLEKGGTVTVELESNPTTGFDWYVQGTLPSQLATASDDFAAGGQSGVVGAGGTRRIVYNAVATGTGTLKLGYQRSWETTVAPEKTFTVTVDVAVK